MSSEIEAAGLDADQLRWIAQGLIAAGRDDDGCWLQDRIKDKRGSGAS
jgi:hypothetical protein